MNKGGGGGVASVPCASTSRARAGREGANIEGWGQCQAGKQWRRGPKVCGGSGVREAEIEEGAVDIG
jgi:hypothetical protein